MPSLPQLIEEDIRELNGALGELLRHSEATAALVIDKGGFLITQGGESEQFDLTTIAALAAASFAATETIATLVSETTFTSIYQQGESSSLFVANVDEYCLLTVIFPATVSVGAVKYFAARTIGLIAAQLAAAKERAPGSGFDLSAMNLADPTPLFRMKTA